VPPFRTAARALFAELITASGATHITSQSNDLFLSSMLCDFAHDISADTVLFADHVVTAHMIADAVVRRRHDDDQPFPNTTEPLGDYVLDVAGEIVATGGFLLHYNVPFADLYMETLEDRRRLGYGELLLQEVKKACYMAGRVPAARTNIHNIPSRATLTRAGLREAGSLLLGTIRKEAGALAAPETLKRLAHDAAVGSSEVEPDAPSPLVVARRVVQHHVGPPRRLAGRGRSALNLGVDPVARLASLELGEEPAHVVADRLVVSVGTDAHAARMDGELHVETGEEPLEDRLATGRLWQRPRAGST
jgi:hypothetical protein